MTAQIIEIAGEKMAMLPLADYQHLLEIAEDQADIAAAERAEQRQLWVRRTSLKKQWGCVQRLFFLGFQPSPLVCKRRRG